MLNRRDFVKTFIAGTASFAFLPHMTFAGKIQINNGPAGLCNRLTIFSLLEDVANLGMRAKIIPLQLISFVHADYNTTVFGNFSRMGWMVNASEQQVFEMIQKEKARIQTLLNEMTKAEKDNPESAPMIAKNIAECKVALMVGWAMAAGIRDVLLPVWADGGEVYAEMMSYQDMFILKQISGLEETDSEESIESLFREMVPRMITRTHTLTPDYDDGPDWTVRISDWRDEVMQQLHHYADIYVDPEPDKTKQYIEDINFYDSEDAIIKAARGTGIVDLSEISPPVSLYGKAILKGLEGISRAGTQIYPTPLDEKGELLPQSIILKGNYPNPFNNSTVIRFDLPHTASVKLSVTNILGQVVYNLQETSLTAGPDKKIKIDATGWASGHYFYKIRSRINSKEQIVSGRMLLVK